ncbi:MAG: M20 metallopeptidase family protein [Thermodesulfobacteriota bacterium]
MMMSMEVAAPDHALTEWMRGIRRRLHQHPELSGAEHETAALIASSLHELGIAHRRGVAGTGVVAWLGGNRPGLPGVALRADMDALPISEETGLPFASQVPGVMHACGHDGHVAMLLGAAALLAKTALPGRVVLLFQPAEEGDGGAARMIEEGALDGVGMIFGGHIDRNFSLRELVVQPGLICASTDEFRIEITGPGGHGAKPHETADCIVAAAQLINSLQTIVSRELHPCLPAVVTVGSIHGGTAANVIANRVVIEGTVRATSPETRTSCHEALRRMVAAVAAMHRVQAHCSLSEGYPPVVNDAAATALAGQVAAATVGPELVRGQPLPSMGAEDFAYFCQAAPGCMVRFGARRDDGAGGPAHSPTFDFDEEILPTGAFFLARVAVAALAHMASIPPTHEQTPSRP